MKKLVLLFLTIISIGIAFSQTEVNSINIQTYDKKVSFFLSEIDSITHINEQTVFIHYFDCISEYNINDIEKISFDFKDKSTYSLVSLEEEGWDQAIITSDSKCILSKIDSIGNKLFCYGNLIDNSKSLIAAVDSLDNIRQIYCDDLMLCFIDDQDGMCDIEIYDNKGFVQRIKNVDLIPYSSSTAHTRSSSNPNGFDFLSFLHNNNSLWEHLASGNRGAAIFDIMQILTLPTHADDLGNLLTGLEFAWTKNPTGALLSLASRIYDELLRWYRNQEAYLMADCTVKTIGHEYLGNHQYKLKYKACASYKNDGAGDIFAGIVSSHIGSSYPDYNSGKIECKNIVTSNNIEYSTVVTVEPGIVYKYRAFAYPELEAKAHPLLSCVLSVAKYGETFTIDPVVSVSTGECKTTSHNSATVSYTVKNIPSDASVGIKFYAENGREDYPKIQYGAKDDGDHTITLSGLEPSTKYYYYAFVDAKKDKYDKEGETRSFTTNPPDISGSWTCTETYYNGYDYTHPQYKSYSVVLNQDGTVVWDGRTDYPRASWGYSASGKLSISIIDLSTNTYTGGFDATLTADNAKNPSKFTGSINNWSFNDVVGYVGRGGNAIELTR